MNDKPTLKLDIFGRSDAVLDAAGLRDSWLQEQLRHTKIKVLLKKNAALDVGAITLSSEDEGLYLELTYKEANFAKPRNLVGLTQNLPFADMKKLLLANAPVKDADVSALAAQRAQATEAYLQKTIDKARLFIVTQASAPEPKDAKPTRVEFALR
jgi:hypothetical protein